MPWLGEPPISSPTDEASKQIGLILNTVSEYVTDLKSYLVPSWKDRVRRKRANTLHLIFSHSRSYVVVFLKSLFLVMLEQLSKLQNQKLHQALYRIPRKETLEWI